MCSLGPHAPPCRDPLPGRDLFRDLRSQVLPPSLARSTPRGYHPLLRNLLAISAPTGRNLLAICELLASVRSGGRGAVRTLSPLGHPDANSPTPRALAAPSSSLSPPPPPRQHIGRNPPPPPLNHRPRTQETAAGGSHGTTPAAGTFRRRHRHRLHFTSVHASPHETILSPRGD